MNIIRGAFIRILQLIARFGPGATTLRPFLHKLRGVKIHGRVFIGDDCYIETAYPECITLHDGAGIALRSTLIAHYRGTQAKIIIGKDAEIMVGCIIIATDRDLTIGECSVVAAGSVVTKDVPPYTLVAGSPARPIAKITVPKTFNTSYKDFKNGLVKL